MSRRSEEESNQEENCLRLSVKTTKTGLVSIRYIVFPKLKLF